MNTTLEETLEGLQADKSEPVEDVKEETVEAETSEDEAEEQAEGADSEAEETQEKAGEAVEEDTKKAESEKSALQKRIDRQTAANRAQAEKIRQLQEELEKFAPKQEDKAPVPEDFDSFEEYHKANVEYEAEKRANAILQQQKQAELARVHQQRLMEQQKAFESAEQSFRATTPDYDDKMIVFRSIVDDLSMQAQETPTVQVLGQAIMKSNVAPAIIYEIASNPDIVDDLVRMDPLEAVKEIWKMEQKVLSKPLQKKEPLPQPIKPVAAKGKPTKSLVDMTADELAAHMAKLNKR